MAGPYKRWSEIRDKKLTPEERDRIAREVEQDLIEMDLQEVRSLVGKTQVEMAQALDMTQPEVSRLEHRQDMRLSTLKRAIEALGGELEVFAAFGDKRVRLRAVG